MNVFRLSHIIHRTQVQHVRQSVRIAAGAAVCFPSYSAANTTAYIKGTREYSTKTHAEHITPEEPYINWGMSCSYFTRKLDAAFKFYPFQYEFKSKTLRQTNRLEKESGTHRIPVVQTSQGKLMADTTVIMDHLDTILVKEGMPDRQMYGNNMNGVVIHVLEEYFDEWFPRHALLWRWTDEETTVYNQKKMGKELLPAFWEMPFRGFVGKKISRWGVRAMRATGLEFKQQQLDGREESLRVFAMMDKQLRQTPFLLGHHPCAVDCVVLGGMWGHFANDPAPKKALKEAGLDRLLEWGDENYQHPPPEEWRPLTKPQDAIFACDLLTEMTEGPFREWTLLNMAALSRSEKSFTMRCYSSETSFLARSESEKARRRIRDRVRGLRGFSAEEHKKTVDWLDSWGLLELYGGNE
ncbi:hypothetical protein SARC_04537 [Sphaeroforma arctica JP610]|uniref:GST N-terminal domain-containing protein n=1 Tax=Sphaeroforma arctica JP610 TaxID=667725 RepID=A0A0L0G253_9EUKA|nr:hypothetical protein SARC_04537 [Sphaeroforma arctica JP610]KNC83212.1 hypothetical protein SARC_04537 [Sphaeroforma arctica JP610]|eukprot:XP_014157114.1 hypothetical protein SARC_04537 [Sphaeroforma arctica JP610]